MPDRSSLFAALTHGRHCPCTACRLEDWTRADLGDCGMHGDACPRVYDPVTNHPETLFGYDGEPPHFVRHDLAKTEQEAAEYLARENEQTVEEYGRGMDDIEDIHLVWMTEDVLTHHDDQAADFECEDDDCNCRDDEGTYSVVKAWEPGAVAYWRWGW